MERYSAFVLDLETTCCFLADHEIKLGPRNIPKPVVDYLSFGLPAQFESQKALRDMEPLM
jgi:hypothetical protein